MKASRLLFKKRISILGLCLFLIVSLFKISYKAFKWLFKSIIKTIKWIKNYIHFINSGYNYNDVYNIIISMDGREFEKFCYYLFKELGYNCKLTKQTNDYGRDIIISTDEEDIFIECKHYTGENQIGREIIQKLSGAMSMLNAEKGIVITTGKVHSNAYEAIDMLGNIDIWDITDIMRIVYKVEQKRIPYILMKSLNNNGKIIRLKPCVK